MNAPPVLIVGAGPTGLVLGLWLTRLGVPVRIIDKTAEAGTTSRALACAELSLPLHAFAWQPEMRRAGLRRGALYLIRPDGHVALADRKAKPDRLRQYFAAREGLGRGTFSAVG